MTKFTDLFSALAISSVLAFGVSCEKEKEEDGDTLFIKGEGFTDIDGNEYETVIIGDQEWAAENLRTFSYSNGDPIQLVESASEWATGETGYWCYMENNIIHNTPYGKLYNWYAVSDSRGLCPSGWRVSTVEDWSTLCETLGGDGVAGSVLKDTGTEIWLSPNAGATNSSGFTAVPSGGRGSVGEFISFKAYARFWTGSEIDIYNSLGRSMSFDQIWVGQNPYNKHFGFCVRCVKE